MLFKFFEVVSSSSFRSIFVTSTAEADIDDTIRRKRFAFRSKDKLLLEKVHPFHPDVFKLEDPGI